MLEAETLILDGKYLEAAKFLDAEIAKKEDARPLYLRAIVSYRMKNYEYALEVLEHALFLKKQPDYLKLKAIIRMEMLDFPDAIDALEQSLSIKKDAETYFFLSICHMLLGNPKSREFLKLAYSLDKARTKSLINDFYDMFFRNNRFVSETDRKALEARITAIK